MQMTAETNHRQPRIWPWVLITVGLLLLAVVAILSNPSPSKPRIQVVYAGNVTSTDFEGETWAVFWATRTKNASVRQVCLIAPSVAERQQCPKAREIPLPYHSK